MIRNSMEIPQTVSALLNALHTLDACSISDNPDIYLDTLTEHDAFIKSVTLLADTALIDYDGKCHWGHIELLKTAGYNVFPGETDSWGWLSGCIQTKKGIIVYG